MHLKKTTITIIIIERKKIESQVPAKISRLVLLGTQRENWENISSWIKRLSPARLWFLILRFPWTMIFIPKLEWLCQICKLRILQNSLLRKLIIKRIRKEIWRRISSLMRITNSPDFPQRNNVISRYRNDLAAAFISRHCSSWALE